MFKKINLQFLISYLGLSPFLIILIDKYMFHQFDTNIMKDFIIFYSLIIIVFIGAIKWDLSKNLSAYVILLGFVPSLFSSFIILLFFNSYQILWLIIFFFLIQLIFDSLVFKEGFEKKIYFTVRVPLTLTIVLCLIFIQL